MLTIEQARTLVDGEPDILEVIREVEEVQAGYREVLAAMSTHDEPEVAPVLNSADVTLSFQTMDAITVDLSIASE